MPHHHMRLSAKKRFLSSPLGIMQGRLTPPNGRGIQFFPFDNWKKEFSLSKKIGLNEIEFIFDFYKYRKNPLWSKSGRQEIIKLQKKTGIKVNSICADFFMRRPLFKGTVKKNIDVLGHLIRYASEIGAKLIEIPFVDNSSITGVIDEQKTIEVLKKISTSLEKYNIKIGLETDIPARKFRRLIKQIRHPMIGANYDTGNSASLGYNPQEEIRLYGKHIFNVHLKDRIFRKGSVELGKGDAQFNTVFRELKKVNYKGPLILQAARGEDGKEKETIKRQAKFFKQWI